VAKAVLPRRWQADVAVTVRQMSRKCGQMSHLNAATIADAGTTWLRNPAKTVNHVVRGSNHVATSQKAAKNGHYLATWLATWLTTHMVQPLYLLNHVCGHMVLIGRGLGVARRVEH